MLTAAWFILILVLLFTKEGHDFLRDMFD
ncbi:hypothetical protein SELR_pSRC400020 (plasmid) [Selenomonas ruminantium subsp. lactilytica TAM6421]|uniref:Uncharacterized protein n=1 Tax=Selenomonas ruminantium subsp. lactilytica (strain NBRC 103574 / TAM6421) TaxID=927704 RepID=I0GV66_SELRL|nr:hypothetical protein SELR_pSRC400020 [Selenomonas ruminantium subsp. lactilytica TAM6421]